MAEASIEERHLLKSLRWWDGFVIALCNPGFLIASLGFSMQVLGTWGAVLLWAISAGVGMLQTWIYAETASMFPDKPGGISLYAHEGWRGRFSLVGPIGAFGYWIGWSVVLSIFGVLIGTLVQAQWFSSTTGTVYDGVVHLGLPQWLGIGCIVLVWLLNIFGIRPAVWISYVTGAGLMVPLGIFIIGPYVTGNWHSSNMTWSLHGAVGFKTAMVYLFLFGWSAYAAEVCATFAPEYHDTKRDTAIALRSAAVFTLLVFLLFPLGIGGVSGAPVGTSATGEFYVPAMAKIVGSGAAGVIIVLLIGSLFLSMISSTADGSRALYGIARDGMTVKQLYHLNRFHVPARAMTVDLVVNVLLVLFISSNLAILYMSNIGYVLSHFLALTGFLLLRRDRPNWPRPIRVGAAWVAIAALLAAFNAVLIGFGVAFPALTGYGTRTDMWIGIGVLVASVLLFFYRRIVQDKQKVTFREEVPTEPSPEQMALLGEEAAV
jgi:amino acid transporter